MSVIDRARPGVRPYVGARLPLLVLGMLLLLRTALLFGGDAVVWAICSALGRSDAWPRALAWSNVTVVVVDLVTLAVLIMICRREGRSVRSLLGVVRLRRDVPLGLLLVVPLGLALVIGSYLGNLVAYGGPPPVFTAIGQPPLWLGIWSIVIMPVTVATAEELFYRGFLLNRWAARIGWWPAAIVVSLAFGLQHAAFSATSVAAVVARVIATSLAGLVFALFARRLGRLVPLIIGHWLVDVIGLGLPVLLAAWGFGR